MNKRLTLLLLAAFIFFGLSSSFAAATDAFITDWDLSKPGSGPNKIQFTAFSSGNVTYSWTTLPASTNSGNGTFNGDLFGSIVTISGLPASATIRLSIDTVHFQSIQCGLNSDGDRLVNVLQWGTAAWTSMKNAFNKCSNLQIAATDIPNLSKLTDMSGMFNSCTVLNTPTNINNWNVSKVTDMSFLFYGANSFNQNIASWNVSKVTNMSFMFFASSSFNQNITGWNVGSVTDMSWTFGAASVFNQNIAGWNVSKVTNMLSTFYYATVFNQNISSWDVSMVTDMSSMFERALAFNQNIGNWNVSKVTGMRNMFNGAGTFNQNIGNWDVSKVTDMNGVFGNAHAFNQNISGWNVSKVTDMGGMFSNTNAFNQNLGSWDVSKVTDMSNMFFVANGFNQSLALWAIKLNSNVNLASFLNYSGISSANYDATLTAFNTSAPSGKNMGAVGLKYCTAMAARANLVKPIASGGKGWTITGDTTLCTITAINSSAPTLHSKTSIFPNPAQESATISLSNGIEGNVEISNSLGQLVYSSKVKDQENISLIGLKNGIYTFKIDQGKGIEFLRVVKQ